jgi:hypothetical protein
MQDRLHELALQQCKKEHADEYYDTNGDPDPAISYVLDDYRPEIWKLV